MSLSHQLVAEIVRQRLGIPDASQNARFLLLIPQALTQFARKIAASEHKRNLLFTDRTTATLTLDGSGVGDLTALIASPGILIEFLHYGQIYAPSAEYPEYPLQKCAPHAGFLHALHRAAVSDSYVHYYIEADKIYTINSLAGTPLSGDLQFAVPYVPTVAQIPAQLEDEFIDKVVELAMLNQDVAEDGQK